MKRRRTLRVAAIAILICVALGGTGIGVVLWSIDLSVKKYAAAAQEDHPHPDDDVAALMDQLASDSASFRDRNHAVWALGRLKDPRARSLLESFYTGGPCVGHDRNLCQHELEKAIRRCGGTPTPPRNGKHD